MNQKIESVKKEFAPDKRVAIFEVTATENEGTILLKGKTNLPEAKDKLLKELEGFEIDEEIEVLPAERLGEKTYGIVTISVANIRSKPDHPAELATQALLGTPVKVWDYDDGFYRIQTPDGYISWVDGDGIERVDKAALKEWINSEKVIYTNDYGFAYSSPTAQSERVSDLVLGDILKKIGEEGEFIKVEFPDERIAFVEKNFTMDLDKWVGSRNADESKIVATAKTMMGLPYLWGGTSAKGVDCSGFTKTVYYMNGIILPRDASQQIYSGNLVDTSNDFENLRPGDLLFFGRKATDEKPERATHVALYIGNGEYIHSSGRVRINSLDPEKENFSEYRFNSFLRAKRILDSIDKNGISTLNSNKFYTGEF